MYDGFPRRSHMGADLMCTDCSERRKKLLDALLHAKIAEAAKQAALGAAEMAGLKEKGDG